MSGLSEHDATRLSPSGQGRVYRSWVHSFAHQFGLPLDAVRAAAAAGDLAELAAPAVEYQYGYQRAKLAAEVEQRQLAETRRQIREFALREPEWVRCPGCSGRVRRGLRCPCGRKVTREAGAPAEAAITPAILPAQAAEQLLAKRAAWS